MKYQENDIVELVLRGTVSPRNKCCTLDNAPYILRANGICVSIPNVTSGVWIDLDGEDELASSMRTMGVVGMTKVEKTKTKKEKQNENEN